MPRIKSLSPKILISVDWNFDMWKNVDWKSVDYKNLCNILNTNIVSITNIWDQNSKKSISEYSNNGRPLIEYYAIYESVEIP
jgi:hypothetical protein